MKRCHKRNACFVSLGCLFWLPSALLATGGTCAAIAEAADEVPGHLHGYEELYRRDPHAAAVAWFKDAKFGLFVHYALASVLEGGKPEYLRLTTDLEKQLELSKLPALQRATVPISKAIMRRARGRKGLL